MEKLQILGFLPVIFVIWTQCFTEIKGDACTTSNYFGQSSPSSLNGNVDGDLGESQLLTQTTSTFTISCCGKIASWEYYAASNTGDAYLQVWRNLGTTWQLVGQNILTFTASDINQAGSYSVPTNEQITVIENDLIGMYHPGNSIIAYKPGGGNSASNKFYYTELITSPVAGTTTFNWASESQEGNRRIALRANMVGSNSPTFGSNLDHAMTIYDNVGSGTTLYTIAATDADATDTLVYTLDSCTGASSSFTFDSSTLKVTTSGSLSEGATSCQFTVTDDCGNAAMGTLDITVLNNPPVINNLPGTATIIESQTAELLLLQLDVTDQSPSDTVTCSISTTVPSSTDFLIKTVPGSTDQGIYVQDSPTGLDYDAASRYNLTVTCSDTKNDTTGIFTVYITQNAPPVFTNLPENVTISATTTVSGTLVYTVTSTDAENDQLYYNMTTNPSSSPFVIHDSGNVEATVALTTAISEYYLSIYVYDGYTLVGPSILTIFVPGSSPTFGSNLDHALEIYDNVGSGATLYTIAATDADATDTLVYTLDSCTGASSSFTFDSSTLQVTTNGTLSAGATSCQFTVTDDAGNTDTGTLDITVLNNPPVINNLPNTATIIESQTAELLLLQLDVTDQSPSDTVTCSISTTDPSTDFLIKTVPGLTDQGIYVQDSPTGLDYDAVSQYNLTVTCSDTKNDTTGIFTVYITQNAPPVFANLPANITISASSTVSGTVVNTVTSTDAENDQLYYNMTTNPASSPFVIYNSGNVEATVDLTTAISEYYLSIYVYDGYTLVGPSTLTIFVTGSSPTFGSNLDHAMGIYDNVGSGTVLYTIAATDADATDTLLYTLDSCTGASSSFTFDASTLQVNTSGSLSAGATSYQFTVTDNAGNTDTGTLDITVLNSPPVINNLPNTATISESQTAELLLLQLDVTDQSPSDTVTCSISTTDPSSTDFQIKNFSSLTDHGIYVKDSPTGLDYDAASRYNLTVTCSDTKNDTTGTFTVYITQNAPPVFTNLPENVTISATTTVSGTLVYTVTSTDAENDQLYYNMTTNPSSSPFGIHSSGNVEATVDLTTAITEYYLSIYVYDGHTLVGPSTLTIFVTGSSPTFGSNLDHALEIYDNVGSGTSLYTIAATDADTTDTLVYTLVSCTGASSSFTFDSSTLQVTSSGTLSAGATSCQFTVTDDAGNTDTGTLDITVLNNPPVINNLPNTATISESQTTELLLLQLDVTDQSPSDTVTCSISATDPSSTDFLIKNVSSLTDHGIYVQDSPTGLDYDAASRYNLTVTCSDTKNDTTGTFTVYITQNAPPVLKNLPENVTISATSTVSGTLVYTVTSTDAENDQLYYNMTTNPSSSPFVIHDSGNVEATLDLTTTSITEYYLDIYVYDGHTLVGPSRLTVFVTDINIAPVFINLPLTAALSVPENSALGSSIFQVSVTDANAGDTHTYNSTYSPSTGSNYFTISETTGEISTSSSTSIDFEALATTSYNLTVTVFDGLTTSVSYLEIEITDVNEAPSFSQSTYSLTVDEGLAGDIVGTPSYNVTDPDAGENATYSIDCSQFSIDPTTGQITFTADYDVDSGAATSATCTVTVSDGVLTDTASLVITINNINENTPQFTQSSYTLNASTADSVGTTIGTISANDLDIGAFGVVTYTLDQSSLSQDYFNVTSTGDVVLINDVQALTNLTSVVITATATDSGGLSQTVNITIEITPTTTTTTTTTSAPTDRYRTFFEDWRNIAWFIYALLTFIGSGVFLSVLAYKSKCCRRCSQASRKARKPSSSSSSRWPHYRRYTDRKLEYPPLKDFDVSPSPTLSEYSVNTWDTRKASDYRTTSRWRPASIEVSPSPTISENSVDTWDAWKVSRNEDSFF